MNFVIAAAPFIGPALGAALSSPLQTLTIPLPPHADPFSTTVPGCGSTVGPFAIVGINDGIFAPGTQTITLPPQASLISRTYTATDDSSAVETIIFTSVGRSCAAFDGTPTADFTDRPQLTSISSSGTPTANATADCPLGTLASTISKTAQEVIDGINEGTLVSQNLQVAARRIGGSAVTRGADREPAAHQFNAPIKQVASGLRDVVVSLTSSIPRITSLPPFDPTAVTADDPDPGDASDAIVIALISFVRVHQALLHILIGQAELLITGPFGDAALPSELSALVERDDDTEFEDNPFDRFLIGGADFRERAAQINPIGAPIAAVLRQVEAVVDQLAFAIIDLIPSRSECAKAQKAAIDATLQESIAAYS